MTEEIRDIGNKEDSWIYLDKHRLDEECERQVRLKIAYGKILATQRRERAKKNNELKIVKAEVDKEVRADPTAFGIAKWSEKACENAVLMDKRVQKLIQEDIEAEFWVGVREAEVYALSDRKSMLEKEIDLFLSGYYSTPRPSSEKPKKSAWERRRDQEMEDAFTPSDNKGSKGEE